MVVETWDKKWKKKYFLFFLGEKKIFFLNQKIYVKKVIFPSFQYDLSIFKICFSFKLVNLAEIHGEQGYNMTVVNVIFKTKFYNNK